MSRHIKCIVCGKKLPGKRRKYCSDKCKNKRHQSYSAQNLRGRKKKIDLVNLFGGKCSECGYDKNLAALTFHHLDPKEKSFKMDMRSLSNRKWSTIKREADKCILLCANCHAELHSPDLNDWSPPDPPNL